MIVKKRKVFLLSVVLNFAIMGYLLTICVYKPNFSVNHWDNINVRQIEQSDISPQKKLLIKTTLIDLRKYEQSRYKEIRSYNKELRNIMTREQFDSIAYQRQSEKIKLLKQEIVTRFHDTIKELAAKLDANERQVLAASFKRI